MAFQLENKICYIKQCWSFYAQKGIVNSVRVVDLTAELVIIDINVNSVHVDDWTTNEWSLI